MSYAVLWEDDGGRTRVGKLELRSESLFFVFTNGHGQVGRELPVADISSLWIARGANDRLGGRPVLVLDCCNGGLLRLTTLSGAGALHEVTDFVNTRVGGVASAAPRR